MMKNQSKFLKHFLFSVLFFLFVGLAFYSTIPVAHAAPIRTVIGKIVKISDGDTVHLVTSNQSKLRVRLYGCDAPETVKVNPHTGKVNKPGQPYGDEATDALKGKIEGQEVRLDIMDIDKYRRMVGIIWLQDRNINMELISEGFAEAYPEFLKPPYRAAFLQAERTAKAAKLGIWGLPNYERPSDFRRRVKTAE